MLELNKKNVFIVGLGQIGASIGLDLVKFNVVARVCGYDINYRSMEEAITKNAVHYTVATLEQGIALSQIIVLAAPIRIILHLLPKVMMLCEHKDLVLDVASTKREIMSVARRFNANVPFIGGHPLAGNENKGIKAATHGKFRGKPFILVPPDLENGNADCRSMLLAREFVEQLGAFVYTIDEDIHDQIMALTIGLPHITALSLMALMQESNFEESVLKSMTGNSFRSATRVTGSSPDLILDMFMTNREEITHCIETMISKLDQLRTKIALNDEDAIKTLITNAGENYGGRTEVCHAI